MLTREQQIELLDRVDSLRSRTAAAATRAKDEAADYMAIALSGGTAAAIGALNAYRGTEELAAGVSVDLAVAAAGLGFSMFGASSKRTRDAARAVGTGALSCYAFKWGSWKGADYRQKHPAAPAKTSGLIGAGSSYVGDDDLLRLATLAAR